MELDLEVLEREKNVNGEFGLVWRTAAFGWRDMGELTGTCRLLTVSGERDGPAWQLMRGDRLLVCRPPRTRIVDRLTGCSVDGVWSSTPIANSINFEVFSRLFYM